MDRNAALTRLGLTGDEDPQGVTRAYGQQLSSTQERLVSAQTDAEREQHQTALSGLVEAYEFLTLSGRYTRTGADDSSATVLRGRSDIPVADVPAAGAAHDTFVRMETGAVLSSRLEIGALLGQGGMGNVYAARDRLKDEDVAIKVLRQDLLFSTAAKERFLAEAKVSCNLSHPNIVRVYDVGLSGNHYYFSMERLKGHTLRQRIETYNAENREFAVAEVSDIARQLIDALRYAHRYIVHRDLKPENIWLSEDGTVKLMDFGIARAYSNSQLTQTGMTLGTAYYMAPEQRLAAKEVDWRADQYALGVVLYELLAGTIPMGSVKPLDKARRDLPKRYADALMRAMSPKPDDRWPSLNDLLAEIAAPPGKSAKAGVILLAGAAAAIVAAAGIYFFQQRPFFQQRATTAAATTTAAQTSDATEPETATAPTLSLPALPATASEPPSEPPAAAQSTQGPPAQIDESPSVVQLQPEPAAPATPIQRASVLPAQTKVAAADTSRNARRLDCMAQCERDDGECRSINRRGKQDCMRAVGFGGTGRITTSPSGSAAADCVFYGQARCQYAPNRDACLARTSTRYNECVNALNGSVATRRQDCDSNAREADQLCLAELRDCRSYCE